MTLHYKIIGLLSLGLGTLGAFLPLLPTTCFVLLAAWCFAKSSPKWHQRLCNNVWFGPSITEWEKNRCIPAKAKIIAITSMLSFGTLSFFIIDDLALRISLMALVATGIIVVHYFNRRCLVPR